MMLEHILNMFLRENIKLSNLEWNFLVAFNLGVCFKVFCDLEVPDWGSQGW